MDHKEMSMKAQKQFSPAKQTYVIPNSFELKGRTFNGFHVLPKQEAQRLYKGLTKYGNACGCNEGAVGVLFSIGLNLLVGPGKPILLTVPAIVSWQMGIVIAVAGGVVGKVIGLWWAYLHFESLRREFDVLTNERAKTNVLTADTNQIGGI